MTVSQVPLSARSIRYLKGVGPHRMRQLAQLGVDTVEDACYCAPARYEDRSRLTAIRDARPTEAVTIHGRIQARSARRIQGGRVLVEAAIEDASGVCRALWFNQPYLAQQLHVGDEVILYGRVEAGRRPQLIHPELERLEAGEEQSLHMGRIVPVYPLVSGITQRWLRTIIATALEQHSGELDELLPSSLLASHGWPSVGDAVRTLHFPSTWESLERARTRLAFEELFLLQVALAQRRAATQAVTKPHRYQLDGPLLQQARQRLPFRLTASQERVLQELCADLAGSSPMRRLLQGDVGCGKTVMLMLLMAIAVQSGYQVALMAPTELLAEQHVRVVQELLGQLGVRIELLSQAVPVSQHRLLLHAIAEGDVSVVVGTQALIQRRVAFSRLALVIIDEQHKFGVAQRATLAGKAQEPDVLVLTATPIPRTMALSLYGDLAISTITELPPGRRPVAMRRLSQPQRETAYELIRQALAKGRQAYVVYPLVDTSEILDLRAAAHMAKHLQSTVFPTHRVGLLHGQMKSQDKERIMHAFVRNEIQVLVSTVIVEVGLDVPNATVMLIEHPERFGLAQLHQLRGRIGRSEHQATCVIISDAGDPNVRQRLSAFVELTDGFALAEKDLELRGPGQLLGRAQHGWLRFRVASLLRDRAWLDLAQQEAAALVQRDPQLRDPALSALRRRLTRWRTVSHAAN